MFIGTCRQVSPFPLKLQSASDFSFSFVSLSWSPPSLLGSLFRYFQNEIPKCKHSYAGYPVNSCHRERVYRSSRRSSDVFQGVRVGPLTADESGVQFNTRELALSAGERGILIIPNPER